MYKKLGFQRTSLSAWLKTDLYVRLPSASLKLLPSSITENSTGHSLAFCYSNWQKCPFRAQLMCMTSWTLSQTVHHRNGKNAQYYIQASVSVHFLLKPNIILALHWIDDESVHLFSFCFCCFCFCSYTAYTVLKKLWFSQ